MGRLESGTYVQVIETGRIGEVLSRERTNVVVEFYDVSSIYPEEYTFKDYELKVVELPRIKTSQLGPFVRGEINLTEITNGTHLLSEYVETDSKAYRINAKDLLIGVKHYDGMPVDDVYRWLETIMLLEEEMHFPADMGENIVDSVTEKDIITHAYYELSELRWNLCDFDPLELPEDAFDALKDMLGTWIESGGKEYPDIIKQEIASQFDDSDIDKQSEATQKLYKECLDYCCDVKKDPKAIQRRGYCYYCGTKIYPNDWIKARDAFIEYYQMTGDASAANTLGYIYYYGRCNGGVPEYEQAFKYFSIGHAYSYFESTYKLADMLAHGYGVVKDGESANHLYYGVYKQNLKRFIRGDFECKFADAALRMGNVFRDGIGAAVDMETAYFYYLQADYAIRKRTENANQYGDTVVFNGIRKALEETRKEYTETGRKEKYIYPGWTKWTLIKHRRCKLTIKELKNGVLAIDAKPLKRHDENEPPQMLITIPRADYCELKKKIRIKTAPNSRYGTLDEKHEIIFDSVEYDWGERKTSFYLYDELTGEIYTEYYTLTAPAKKKPELTGAIHHLVSVLFEESGRCYDYLCDDESVKVDDIVIVKGYDGEKAVKVVAVSDKYESELVLPIEKYKKIIRKA